MPQLLWDASALVKKYIAEVGSDTVDALFAVTPAVPMVVTFMGYAETAAILRRKFNQAVLDLADFTNARLLLEHEVLANPLFHLMTVDDTAVLAGIALTDSYNLNASDAAMLEAYLRHARGLPQSAPVCVLVASDQRLLKAAIAESLQTLNPESVSAADVPALLASM